MKFVDNGRLFFAVSLVDRKKERASGFTQKLHEFNIRCRDFRPAIDHHNDRGRLVKRDPRLAKDFRREESILFRKDSAGVDNADAPPAPFGISVQTIARDSRLITNDGTARADDPVEQRGLAYVGSAHDGERRNARCRGGESASRVVGRLGQSKLDLSSMWGQPPRLSFVSQDPRVCGSRLFGVTARTAEGGRPHMSCVPMHFTRNSYYRDSRGFKFPTRFSFSAFALLPRWKRHFASPILRTGRCPRTHASGIRIPPWAVTDGAGGRAGAGRKAAPDCGGARRHWKNAGLFVTGDPLRQARNRLA